MTGIEELRHLAQHIRTKSATGYVTVVASHHAIELEIIADQIERERACDEDAIENVRPIVGGVIDDMERHISGVEGAEDSPVARWARELRRALKSDTSDAAEQQKPSCHDPAEMADVSSEVAKVTRDPAEDVSMSAYDLLPADEREAIAWVREHGGPDAVKELLDWVVGHCSTRQQLDFDFWLSGRVMYELGFEEDMADRDEVERRLLARLMPEGMEWLVEAWPRFEDDGPVRFLDDFERCGDENGIAVVTMYSDGSFALNFRAYSKGERVNRPAPKVLDADGVEIRVGDTVYYVDGREQKVNTVARLTDGLVQFGRINEAGYVTYCEGACIPPDRLTHRAPVLSADGRPLEAGQTVWEVESGIEYEVVGIHTDEDSPVRVMRTDGSHLAKAAKPSTLTHERPVLDAEGNRIEPAMYVWWICEGDERGIHAERLHVDGIDEDGMVECSLCNGGTGVVLEPSELYVNKPGLDADGVPIHEGETVWRVDTGVEYWVKRGQTITADAVVIIRKTDCDCESEIVKASQLTHERPDSWERIEEDAEKDPCGYFGFDGEETCGKCPASGRNCEQTMARDLVRRARALAGRDAS